MLSMSDVCVSYACRQYLLRAAVEEWRTEERRQAPTKRKIHTLCELAPTCLLFPTKYIIRQRMGDDTKESASALVDKKMIATKRMTLGPALSGALSL